MTDLRMFKDEIRGMVDEVNTFNKNNHRSYWPWRVRVLKNEVRLTNGYVKGEYDQDYFRIVHEYHPEVDCVYATNVFDEKLEYFFPGYKHWEDGSLMDCVRKGLDEVDYYFRTRF